MFTAYPTDRNIIFMNVWWLHESLTGYISSFVDLARMSGNHIIWHHRWTIVNKNLLQHLWHIFWAFGMDDIYYMLCQEKKEFFDETYRKVLILSLLNLVTRKCGDVDYYLQIVQTIWGRWRNLGQKYQLPYLASSSFSCVSLSWAPWTTLIIQAGNAFTWRTFCTSPIKSPYMTNHENQNRQGWI